MKNLILALVALLAFTAVADRPKGVEIVGGTLTRPGALTGRAIVVNAQGVVPSDSLTNSIRTLNKSLNTQITVQDSEPLHIEDMKGKVKELKAEEAVFLVNDSTCQSAIMIAPDDNWAIVNVAVLSADNAKPAFVAARTNKELMRAFLMLCGAFDSSYDDSVMRGIKGVNDLDKIVKVSPPLDVVGRVRKYLFARGVETRPPATYLKACQEGWAPPPTNDIQKAIWNRVHAIPDKPITIEYDPKKDK